MVPAEGFEPPTYGLQNRCTTTVLSRQNNNLCASSISGVSAYVSNTVKVAGAGAALGAYSTAAHGGSNRPARRRQSPDRALAHIIRER
jgi:hypothetical protein